MRYVTCIHICDVPHTSCDRILGFVACTSQRGVDIFTLGQRQLVTDTMIIGNEAEQHCAESLGVLLSVARIDTRTNSRSYC